MTITVTFSSGQEYNKRYVRKSLVKPGRYEYYITANNNSGFDAEQGFCDESDLPEEIKNIADSYDGAFYACEWPIC